MAYRLRRLTTTLLLRLLRVTLLLLLVVVVGVGLLLLNPHWLVGVVQNELAYQGIDAQISDISVDFSGTTYRLQSNARATSRYGVQVNNAHLDATIDWYAIWQRKPFMVQASLSNADVVIDRNELSKHLSGGGKGQLPDLSAVLPLTWVINNGRLLIDNHQLTISADGHQDRQINAVIADNQSGEITAAYSKDNQQLILNSQQMHLAALTGYAAVLRNTTATINTQNWLNSELLTELEYQNITSEVSIKPSGDRIQVTARADDKVAAAEIALQGDDTHVYFSDWDLSIYQLIKPLIPVKLNLSHLGGHAAGQLHLQHNRLVQASLKLADLQLTHPALVMDNADVEMTLANGIVTYNVVLDDSEWLLPTVFEQDSNRLSGTISGRVDVGERLLTVRQLSLSGSDFEQLSASGTVQWDANKKTVLLDIQGELDNADIAKTRRYLPYQMPPKTKSWLGDALISGKQNHTRFTLSGDPKTYKSGAFVLRIDTDFKDSEFRYLKNNPIIHFQSGKFAMDGRQLHVSSDNATIGGLPFVATADIGNVLKTELHVKASMQQQSAKQMIAVAKQTLAKKTVARVEKIVSADGQFDLDLTLLLAIYDKKAADQFRIALQSDKASATLKRYPDLPLRNAKAEVLINREGLQHVIAKGQMQGKPFDVTVKTDKQGYAVKLNGAGEVMTTLRRLQLLKKSQADTLRKAKLISGQPTVSGDIRLDKTGNLQTVALQSDLRGATVNLFSAVKKSTDAELPFTLSYEAKKRFFDATLGRANIQIGLRKNGQIRGALLDNRTTLPRYQAEKIQLNWQSKAFDYVAFNRFRQAMASPKSTSARQSKELPFHVNVQVQALALPNGESYAVEAVGDENSIQINSPILSGVFDFQGERLHGNIRRLAVDELFTLHDKTAINPAGREVKALGLEKALPPLTLVADSVYLKGKNIGNASLRTSENNGHYSIDQFLLSGKDYYIELSGYEATEPQPQGMTTHIQADFKGENLRGVTQLLSLNDIIDARSLDVSLSLSWPGKAHTLNIQQSYGEGTLSAQNLKMLNIDTGVGGLFGLMDITGILKRVTLDFKNVTTSKIAFDRINGRWNVGGGRAVTRDFYAEGSIIAMKLSGPVDLYRREFDNVEMTVIPKTSNVLPVVGAVTGGVVGSAIGLAVQQVFGKQIDEAIGLPYVIAGTWEHPTVTFRGDTQSTAEPSSQAPHKTADKITDATNNKHQQPNVVEPTITLESLGDTIDDAIPVVDDATAPPKRETQPDTQTLQEWVPDSDWHPTQPNE